MSSIESQSRSSVDLGVGSPSNNPEVKANNARSHPPRLQHSPSLPNIWFPPHSGPIPPQFEEITREPLRRLSTPPRPDIVNLATSSLAKPSVRKDLDHRESLSFEHAQTRPLKISMRRRADREQGHTNSLLTPPLTPSSSLKTAPSSDSVGQADVSSECNHENFGDEADPKSTRFLLLGNVSKQVRHEILRASIVEALTSSCAGAATSPNNLFIPKCHTNDGGISEDSIKGIFLRCQQSNGIAMLAFFDVRHAETANTIIATPSTGPLSQCVGDDLADDGTRGWITCQFISAEELAEVIGSSPFLTSTNASFSLAVEGRPLADRDDERQLRVVADHNNEDGDMGLTTIVTNEDSSDLNIGMLKRFLKSFGGLRFFSVAKDMDDQKQNETIFHIEYYDVRAATSAYAAVDKQTLFGMKLRVFGRSDLADPLSVNQRPQEYSCAQNATPNLYVAEQNETVATASSKENHDELPVQLGYPGQFSHTRERLFVDGPQVHMLQGQEGFKNSVSPVPSPTYFYTSDPTTDVASTNLPSDDLNRSGSEEALYRTTLSDGRPWSWDAGAQFYPAPGLYSHHDCYYCPSQGSPASSPAPNYYVPCSTPSPYCYQQSQPTPPQNGLFPALRAYGYQYDNSYLQSLTPTMSPNPANVFERAMMTAPRPHEFWYPETPVSPPGTQNALYYGPQPPAAGVSGNYDHRTLPEPAGDVYQPNLPLTIGSAYHRLVHPTSLHGNSSSAREPRPSAEHNQLNLSKIEDGQDTRTTVMIKNIPNKMSDKDLVTFIGKVCPRRIDFLYLRMDFQNGCNVGYAFVNFITVQDLLTFAKKKLGQKWNMFSSEKVLQMSYANYQGKEALVEKFKNSCIMDEQEAWRPKIFYSDPGPEQGLPEPFPAPTHIRRKERSAFNRGALYVPGVGRGSSPPGSIAHTRRLEDTRTKNTDRHSQSSTPGSYTPSGNSRRRLKY
ncbi:Meiosis protein mei2 [Termitomyces sp. T112]|nr:Meiosis protein mei2 [Termitomyces sp. T112]